MSMRDGTTPGPGTGPGPAARGTPVGPGERVAWTGVVVLTAALGTIGFVNSFARVQEAMVPYFGGLAWTVPLGVDLGILVFTALDLLMGYRGLRSPWLRFVPWALTGVTIYLNVAGETGLEGQVAHAVLPGLWVVAVEVAGTAVRAMFGLGTARARMDRIRWWRWLLAPVSTARIWRRMVLNEQPSYIEALDLDLAYEMAKADLRVRYGRLWRWTAPRAERLLLRRGRLTTKGRLALAVSGEGLAGPAPSVEVAPPSRARATTSSTPPHRDVPAPPAADARQERDRPQRERRSKFTDEQLIAAAEQIADQMASAGTMPSRRTLQDALRDQFGYGIGTDRAGELLAHVKRRAESRSGPQLQAM
jgi:hypothetical protein